MPNNFRIIPSAPEPVSGLSLIDQIENAVNDLGGQYDDLETEVNSKTDQALTASQNAEATANSALQTAQDAETLANEAQNVAVRALNKADQAQIAADGAAVKADLAYDQATLALTDSQTALNNSQTALGQSETALEQSTAAMQTAENAQTSSQAAMEAASQAIGTFVVDDDPCDADAVFKSPEKKYLTSTDNINFPGRLAFPAYFEVMVSSDGNSVTQKCWSFGSSLVFSRTGEVAFSEEDDPVITWEPWVTWDTKGASIPAGFVLSFAANTAPDGWLECNGAELGRAAYPDLFTVIGTIFGEGDGNSTFNLPDLRGEFIRGWDNGRGLDNDRNFGSTQTDAIRNITGTTSTNYGCYAYGQTGAIYGIGYQASRSSPNTGGNYYTQLGLDVSRVVPTADENRPRNVALLTCVKY